MKIFPHACRCDGYLHMRRAAYSTLQKLFGEGQEISVWPSESEGMKACCREYASDVEMWNQTRIKLVKKNTCNT